MNACSAAPLERKLLRFHRPKVEQVFWRFSPIAGRQFPGQFNVAGFYPAVLELAKRSSSFWGIDRCLRIEENIDAWHSRLFHMGVFARSLDLAGDFVAPQRDARLHDFQRDILGQFFALLDALGIPRSRLEASYFDGAILGGHPDGRDARLKTEQKLPPDHVSRDCLQRLGVKCVGVPSIASVFVRPCADSLVGPRLEVFCDGVELATIMFLCFRIRRGELVPINYVGVYGIGVERLVAVLCGKDLLHAIPRYRRGRAMIVRANPAARSTMLEREVLHVLFGLETLAAIPDQVSRAQAARIARMKGELKWFILNLGLLFGEVQELYSWFEEHLE